MLIVDADPDDDLNTVEDVIPYTVPVDIYQGYVSLSLSFASNGAANNMSFGWKIPGITEWQPVIRPYLVTVPSGIYDLDTDCDVDGKDLPDINIVMKLFWCFRKTYAGLFPHPGLMHLHASAFLKSGDKPEILT